MLSASGESVRGARFAPGSGAAAGGALRGWALLAAAGLLLTLSPWHGAYVGLAFCAVVAASRVTAVRARLFGDAPSGWGAYLVGLGALSAVFMLLMPWVRDYAAWAFVLLQAPLALVAFLSLRRPVPSLAEIALGGARDRGGRLRRGYAGVVRRGLERAVINHCSMAGQPPHDFLSGKTCDDVLVALRGSRDDAAREAGLGLALVDRHCVTGAFEGLLADQGVANRRGGG